MCAAGFVRIQGNQCHPCPDRVTCPGLKDELVAEVETGSVETEFESFD
jgi:hypothetical protein